MASKRGDVIIGRRVTGEYVAMRVTRPGTAEKPGRATELGDVTASVEKIVATRLAEARAAESQPTPSPE